MMLVGQQLGPRRRERRRGGAREPGRLLEHGQRAQGVVDGLRGRLPGPV